MFRDLYGVNREAVAFLSGFSSPGYEVFAEADAQGLTDSTAYRLLGLQNKHCAQDGLGWWKR